MGVLLQIKDVYKSYGDQVLLDGAEATLTTTPRSASSDAMAPSRARCCA